MTEEERALEIIVDSSLIETVPEGWKEATTDVAPTAKYVDQFGTYHDDHRKVVAFTQPDGSVVAAE